MRQEAQRQPPVDFFYQTGVPFRFGRYVVEALHTPGHCPGGVCLAIGRADEDAPEDLNKDGFVSMMRVKDPRHYEGEGMIRLYLTDDACRLPVRIESTVPGIGGWLTAIS